MSGPRRKANGRFEEGSSGNKLGRPKKERRRHSLPFKNRSVAFEVAAIEIPVNLNGRSETRSLYEANLIRLGVDGAQGKMSSARIFIQEVNRAAHDNEEQNALVRSLLVSIHELEEEVAELRRRYPTSGVLQLPWNEFKALQQAEEEQAQRRREQEDYPSGSDGNVTNEAPLIEEPPAE